MLNCSSLRAPVDEEACCVVVLVVDAALVSIEAPWPVLVGTFVAPPVAKDVSEELPTVDVDEDTPGRVIVDVELDAGVTPMVVVSRKERVVKRPSTQSYVAARFETTQSTRVRMGFSPALTEEVACGADVVELVAVLGA